MSELTSVLEVMAGAALVGLGLLWLAWRASPCRQHRGTGLLALLVGIVALVEVRRRP